MSIILFSVALQIIIYPVLLSAFRNERAGFARSFLLRENLRTGRQMSPVGRPFCLSCLLYFNQIKKALFFAGDGEERK